MAVLIAQVDTSVMSLGVRSIGRDLHAGVGALQWVVDGYNLVYAAALLTGGLLADLYGRRRLFMAGAAVFTTASALCALAPDIPVLVASRALAGLGAALLLPASLAAIRVGWPDPAERGKALGIWAGCNGLAFVVGPALGGWLIAAFGWRSVFLLALPLGLLALALSPLFVPESADARGRHFDGAGQILGAVFLGALTLAAIDARGAPALATVALAGAALALALFARLEARRGDAALVPLDMFRAGDFRAAMTATAGMTFGMYGVLFLEPLTWQTDGLVGPAGAGLALTPMALVFVVVSSLSGALVPRLGSRVMSIGGVATIGCGLILLSGAARSVLLGPAEAALVVTGVGMGMATAPLTNMAVGAVAAPRSGTAAALINVARMAGATCGVAVLGTVYALAGSGAYGLQLAMLLGGSVQIASAGLAWSWTAAEEPGGSAQASSE